MARLRRTLLTAVAVVSAAHALVIPQDGPSSALRRAMADSSSFSLNVSSCPGYDVKSVSDTDDGLQAKLALAGSECNAFGNDISDLTLTVTYESENRLHVHLYDTAKQQYQIPSSILPPPGTDASSAGKEKATLQFHYEKAPFAFWISRRSDGEVLFDTRGGSLKPVSEPIGGANETGMSNSTAFEAYPLVFEDQYLQIASALPENANIYGLGEYVSSSGFRRDPNATVQTMWARDQGNPVDQNEYGSHAVYVEHRYNSTTEKGQSHAVFLKNSHGMDVILRSGAVEYRAIGGTLDFYFFAGPEPKKAVEQYVHAIGLPEMQPAWSYGLHLCRWGYDNVSQTREAVEGMRKANIPLETQWNDIDYMLAYYNFELASDKSQRFPVDEMKSFIQDLHDHHQHYVMIIDAAIHKVDPSNSSDIYNVYTKGHELDTFMKNPNGTEYIGRVWPGYTVFPDWFAKNTDEWWYEAFRNFSSQQVDFDGVWLDMNEPSSFCEGSCGTGANLSDTDPGIKLPGQPGNLVDSWPEGYNVNVSGMSGNMTVNGTSTFDGNATIIQPAQSKRSFQVELPTEALQKRAAGTNITLLDIPPYAIHNGAGPLNVHTVSVNATHANGLSEYHVHNLWGFMEETSTNKALRKLRPAERPFIIARSTFAGSGRKAAHWLGDNYSSWSSMWTSLQGVMQFGIFGIPMVGADACGFNENSDEELCNRWMQLAAFTPFYRNHNTKAAISQEPFRWDSVAEATRRAVHIRYSLLPYFYSEMARASLYGTPPVRALWQEFPNDPTLLGVSEQLMFGSGILVTPVLEPNVTSVKGAFPGKDSVWRDWYTHAKVDVAPQTNTTLDAPLSHINLHILGGNVFLQYAKPSYTIYETQQHPYALLVALDKDSKASTSVYVDDGTTPDTPSSSWLSFVACAGSLKASRSGSFQVEQPLANVTVLGVEEKPKKVALGDKSVKWSYDSTVGSLSATGLEVDLNEAWELTWS